jgi:hypothetical protein
VADLQPGTQFNSNSLGVGLHHLEAVVGDPTPLVRSDPGGVLTDSHAWDVAVVAEPPCRRFPFPRRECSQTTTPMAVAP